MKYMVLECHPGYAVVLDEEGRFLKVANRQYEVGQMVTDVVQMQVSPRKKAKKWLYSLVAAAACLALLLGLTLPGAYQPYASIYVKINPEIRIDVDKQDTVVGLDGVNQDGIDLIAGYDYHKKGLNLVTDELVNRAIDMGYLQAEGQITIRLDSQDQLWVEDHSQSISKHLHSHLQERFSVTIQVQPHHGDDDHNDHDGNDGHEDYDDHDDRHEDDNGSYPHPDDPNHIDIQPEWEDDDRDDHNDRHGHDNNHHHNDR